MNLDKDMAYMTVILIGLIALLGYVKANKEVIHLNGVTYQYAGMARVPGTTVEIYTPVYMRKN